MASSVFGMGCRSAGVCMRGQLQNMCSTTSTHGGWDDVMIPGRLYSGTPKSSILIGFSIINHPFWGTPIFGNTQMVVDLQNVNAFLKETDETNRPNRAKKGRADDFLREWDFSDMNPFKLFGSLDGWFRFSRGKRKRDLPLKFQNTWYHPNG